MSANPSILNYLASQRLPVPDLSQVQTLPAQAPTPAPAIASAPPTSLLQGLGAPAAPEVTRLPTPTEQRLLGDQSRLTQLRTDGPGVDNIQNPVLHGLAKVGDAAASIFAPRAAQFIPGTTANNVYQQNQTQGRIESGLKDNQQQAQTAQEEALTDYTQQRPDIEQSRIDQKQTAVQERVAQAAAARGQKVTWDANGLPAFQDDMNSQEYKDHQALSAMHQATADKNKVLSDIQQNHYIPGTPEFEEAQRKLSQIDQRQKIAMAGLGLRAQGLELRRNNQNADFYGKGPDGQDLPGTPHILNDAGEEVAVGRRNAPNAEKQQKTVSSFNDLSGSVSHLRNAIKAYEAEGGDMSDARLASAAADPNSTVGKVIQGKLVTNGLSPAAITLLNAQRQTMEQAGILRSTTGGTSSEAGAQRILAVVPQFGSDTNQSAYNKLDEQENVLGRLSPGVTGVAGGLSVKNRPSTAHTTFRQTATGPNGHKIGTNDGTTWYDTQTGKAIE